MSRWLKLMIFASAAVLLTGAAPPTESPAPTLITKPVWTYQPGTFELSCFFPERMERYDILEGGATVRCRADDEGRLMQCRAIEERPKDKYGAFGVSGVRAAEVYRLAPKDGDGNPVAGRTIILGILFTFDRGNRANATRCARFHHPKR
jgi:hypothetical protein